MGDFLQVWPCLYALTTQMPETQFFWAGKESYTLWTSPLGITNSSRKLRQKVDKIYSAQHWPRGLENYQLLWFGLHKPPTNIAFANLFFFYGIENNSYDPPREVYAKQLSKINIESRVNWHRAWLKLFCPEREKNPAQVLIFPGSGNYRRCWPLEKFESIATSLANKGFEPVFVLGPAELERGLQIPAFEQICPDSLHELEKIILKSRMVIGNDSGPLHLAAYMQVPAVGIFGPASSKQWGPPGVHIAKIEMHCSPCSKIGRIACSDPVCVSAIPEKTVMQKIEQALKELA